MMNRFKIFIRSSTFWMLLLINYFVCEGQGLNHQWLLGYDTALFDTNVTSTKSRLLFNQNSFNLISESRKLAFRAAQGNISDENGNLLFASNGCWIMNAMGDTMMNGSGLNPDPFNINWCDPQAGIPFQQSNLVIPLPDDTSKYILFHHSGSNAEPNDWPLIAYYSIIDMTLDNGLGGVIPGQKNNLLIQDKLNIGFSACKHANGRDWWILILRDSSDIIYKILLDPHCITSITTQSLGVAPHNKFQAQIQFSPDGKKMAYRYHSGTWGNVMNEVRLFDFNRCTGDITIQTIVNWQHSQPGLGLSFSPNSKYLYASTFDRIYQINTDTVDIQVSLQLVAVNDGYFSPQPPLQTDFWLMYLAANGKIYISSGSSVIDLHFINYPDSSGIACDVQQHSLHLPCYSGRGHVNHPNYYLGCDTTLGCTPCYVAVNEIEHDFIFNIYPNPSSGNFNIIYMLPQNKEGKLEVFDITGKIVYEMRLPQWSTLQQFNLPQLSQGIYAVKISSDEFSAVRKLVLTD